MIEYDGHTMPGTLRIGSHYWTLLISDDPEDDTGLTDDGAKTITLSDTLKGEYAKDVFLHEVFHALMFTAMPGYTVQARGLKWRKRDLVEVVPYYLSGPLLGFMRDNPIWMFYLMEGVIRVGFSGDDGDDSDPEDEDTDPGSPEDPPGHAGYL